MQKSIFYDKIKIWHVKANGKNSPIGNIIHPMSSIEDDNSLIVHYKAMNAIAIFLLSSLILIKDFKRNRSYTMILILTNNLNAEN